MMHIFLAIIYRIITEASQRADAAKASRGASSSAGPEEPEAIGFFQAFMLPNVMSYAIAFGFFKLVRKMSCFVQSKLSTLHLHCL